MVRLMEAVIYEMFYNLFPQEGGKGMGLTFAEDLFDPAAGHKKGLTISFRSYEKSQSLTLLIYSRGSYPLVAAAWGDVFCNPDKIRNWRFISKHDASVRDGIRQVLVSVDEMNISALGGMSDAIRVAEFSQETRDYLKTLTYDNCADHRKGLEDYLLGKHIPNVREYA